MIGLGTVINTLAIVAGGVLGALLGRFLNDSIQDTLTKVCGVSTLFIAVGGALEEMLTVVDGAVVSSGALLMNAGANLTEVGPWEYQSALLHFYAV